jgi:hypothetical protein
MFAEGSFFLLALDNYNYYAREKYGNCNRCSICASMFIENRGFYSRRYNPSYLDAPPDVIKLTEFGIYINIRNKEFLERKLADCLCYGAALYHVEREINPDYQLMVQETLLLEAIKIISDGKLRGNTPAEYSGEADEPRACPITIIPDEVIVYIEINNGIEKAMFANGQKVTHPHVWIMRSLPDYGDVYHVDHPDPCESQVYFLKNHLIFADALFGINPGSKVYLKFYVKTRPIVEIVRCEIDMIKAK